jgi:RimJ/RimL family protein N-acetyltransferase
VRLVYERPAPRHGEAYERLLLRHEVGKWLRPPPEEPFDAETVAAYLRADIAHWDEHGYGPWAIYTDSGREWAGRAGLHDTELEGESVVELVWSVVPELWGRGIATEAGRAALEEAARVGIDEVVAYTTRDNLASERVMQKLAMEHDGEIEYAGLPHVLYRLSTR